MSTPAAKAAPLITDQLLSIVGARQLTGYALGKASGINPSMLTRWFAGERSLSGDSIDAVGAALGLRLVEGRGGLRETPKRRRKGSKSSNRPVGLVVEAVPARGDEAADDA